MIETYIYISTYCVSFYAIYSALDHICIMLSLFLLFLLVVVTLSRNLCYIHEVNNRPIRFQLEHVRQHFIAAIFELGKFLKLHFI